jgi:hypothetical protein
MVAVGYAALIKQTTGAQNTACGYDALGENTTGTNNTAVGYFALQENTTGNQNVAIGVEALEDSTTAANNNAVGFRSLHVCTTGEGNQAFGGYALQTLTTGSANIGIGYNTGGSIANGNHNVCIGGEAGVNITSGSGNTTVGYTAANDITTGAYNTCIGRGAGEAVTTGSNNIVIGFDAAASSATVSNEITLGNTSVTKFRIPGIGISFDAGTLDMTNQGGDTHFEIGKDANSNQNSYIDLIADSTYTDYALRIIRNDGGANTASTIHHRGTGQFSVFLADGGTASYPTSSDYRLKENVVSLLDGITKLKTLKPYRFNFKHTPSKIVDGFFAHEATAVPGAVTGTKDGVMSEDGPLPGDLKKGDPVYQSVDYSKFVPLLTAALQEAIAKIEILETKVTALEAG